MLCSQRLLVALVIGVILVPRGLHGSALDPSQAISQYGHEVWDEDRGLPQNSVTGKTTIRKLTAIDPQMKFNAVSGLMGDQKVSEIAQLGNVSFLQKPFTTERLLRALYEVLHAENLAGGPPV